MAKTRKTSEWQALTQVSMTLEFLQRISDDTKIMENELSPVTFRRYPGVVTFLEKERLDTKMDFMVSYMPGSSWVYFIQRWRQ